MLASAGIRSRQGRYRDCTSFATDAAADAERAGHRSGLAHALYLEHMMSVYLGEPEDDLAYRSLAISEELGDLVGQGNVLNNLGIGAYYLGRWEIAHEYYERSREARVRSGDVVGAATEENNIAEILSDQGNFVQARALLESARATWLAASYRVGAALATSNLGRLEARAGDVARGRELLEAALGDFRQIHSPVFVAETQLRLAECQVLEGDFASAMSSAQELLGSLRARAGLEQTEVAAQRVLGTAAALARLDGGREQTGASIQALDEAVKQATALEAPYELALTLASRAALADRDLADTTAEAGSARASADRERADAIFDRLGVSQAVITWSTRVQGGPIFARR